MSLVHRHTVRPAGFTLIELLMVVVIIGITTSVAVPSFRGFLQSQKLSAASRDMISSLRRARMSSVNERNPWVVMFLVSQRQYMLFADDGGGYGIATSSQYIEDNRGNLQVDPGERAFGPYDLPAGVSYGMVVSSGLPNGITTTSAVSFAGSPPRIVFYPNGSARETGVIMFQLSERMREGIAKGQRAVVLYKPTGQARSFQYNEAGNPTWK